MIIDETKKTPIKYIGWFITDKCNLKCKHCCISDNETLYPSGELSKKEIGVAIKNVFSWGVKHIHFLGGEPTLRQDFLEILNLCKTVGISTSFNTNGQTIDESYAEEIVKAEVKTVTFSLEGPDPESNDFIRGRKTFRKTIEAIRFLKKARLYGGRLVPPMISLEIGMNRMWTDRLNKMKELIFNIMPESIYLEPTQPEGRAVKYSKEIVLSPEDLLDLMPNMTKMVSSIQDRVPVNFRFFPKCIEYGNVISDSSALCSDHLCLAGVPQVYVVGKGIIIPCNYSTKILGWKGLPNVISSSLEDVLNSPHFIKFFDLWQRGIKKPPPVCSKCDFYEILCEPCPVAPQEERVRGTEICAKSMWRLNQ